MEIALLITIWLFGWLAHILAFCFGMIVAEWDKDPFAEDYTMLFCALWPVSWLIYGLIKLLKRYWPMWYRWLLQF